MKQTAVEWLVSALDALDEQMRIAPKTTNYKSTRGSIIEQAKEMEKEQMGYTKEDVLKAGEMGEINHHDTKHIVSYLDEAKRYNETFNTNEK
jgi:hypothetical protein